MTLTKPLTMTIALHRPGLSITSIEETCIKSTERELKNESHTYDFANEQAH